MRLVGDVKKKAFIYNMGLDQFYPAVQGRPE
jgi:hypothetical protein